MSRSLAQALIATLCSLAILAVVVWLERQSASAPAPPPSTREVPILRSVDTPPVDDDLPTDNPVETRLVTLDTADGAGLTAALFRPDAQRFRGAGVLLLPDGRAALGGAVTAGLAAGLAQAGYPTLVLGPRASDPLGSSTRLADMSGDVRAGIDYLAALGTPQVLLAGHGLGSVAAVAYTAELSDRRVAALGLYGPLDDLPERTRDLWVGPARYARLTADAEAQVARGAPGALLVAPLGTGGADQAVAAAAWLDWRGPAARTRATETVGGFGIPIFVAYGRGEQLGGASGQVAAEAPAQAVYEAATAALWPELYAADGALADDPAALAAATADWLQAVGLSTAALPPTVGARPVARLPAATYQTAFNVVDAAGSAPSSIWYAPNADPVGVAALVVTGSEAALYTGPAAALGPGLAERGYPTLAVALPATAKGAGADPRLAQRDDLRAALDWLATQGYARVALLAAGADAGAAAAYVSQADDPRVRALALVGAPADLPTRTREQLGGAEYARVSAWAADQTARGQGDALTLLPGREGTPQPVSAAAFRAWYADDARADTRALVRGLTQPLLLVEPAADAKAGEELLAAAERSAAKQRVVLPAAAASGSRGAAPDSGSAIAGAVATWLDARRGDAAFR